MHTINQGIDFCTTKVSLIVTALILLVDKILIEVLLQSLRTFRIEAIPYLLIFTTISHCLLKRQFSYKKLNNIHLVILESNINS